VGIFIFKRAPHKQQAVENQSIICYMPNENSTRELEDSGSHFFFLPCERKISTHRDACINYFSYLAVVLVLVSALRGVQSPEGEKTEISLH
jgi:hypothetical protein